MRVIEAVLAEPWAIEESALQTILAIASRENEVTVEALEAYRAKSLATADAATIRDGVLIIDAIGPMIRRANMFSAISGATSYDIMRRDLQAGVDAGAKALLLNIDSPGGAVNGTAELAQAVFDLRGTIPIVAYVGGMGASAAYWLASAASEIVIDPTAMLGSIGVQVAFSEPSPKAGEKQYRFVSSQSPMKNADVGTKEGASALQSNVDSLAQVFVETIARNRGVDIQTVLNNFGKGGMFVGMEAVQAGLADRIGNFEAVVAELSARGRNPGARSTRSKGTLMSENTVDPAAAAAPAAPTATEIATAVADAVGKAQAAERVRISGLNKLASAHGVEAGVLTAAVDEGMTVEAFGLKVADLAIAKSASAGTAALEALKADEAAAGKVDASTTKPIESGEKTAAQVADDIIAAANIAEGK